MTVREHLGRNLAVGGALAVLGMGAVTMTERALAVAPDPPAGPAGTVLSGANNTAGPIADAVDSGPIVPPATTPPPDVPGAATTRSITIAGPGIVRDVDVATNIPHEASGDLEILLTKGGKTVTLVDSGLGTGAGATFSFGPAGGTANVYNGTLWDDQAASLATDTGYTPGVAQPQLVPEGALGSFIGDAAAGTWTLSVRDHDNGGTGNLNAWSLSIATLPAAPALTDSVAANTTVGPISPVGPSELNRSVTISGANSYLWDADLVTDIEHTAVGDLDLLLTHGGKTVPISTRTNGPAALFQDNTLFNDSATIPVTRARLDASLAKTLTPEGAMAAFAGMNPNGEWTLTVRDAADLDGGQFVRFELRLKSTTAGAAAPVTPGPGATPGASPVAGTSGVVLPGPSKKLGLKAFKLSETKAGKVKVSLAWLRGAGKVNWNVRLSTKIGKKVEFKTLKGSGGAGPKTISRTIAVPSKWDDRKVTVRMTIKNGGITIVKTKSITL